MDKQTFIMNSVQIHEAAHIIQYMSLNELEAASYPENLLKCTKKLSGCLQMAVLMNANDISRCLLFLSAPLEEVVSYKTLHTLTNRSSLCHKTNQNILPFTRII